ncbi:MAG: autorepressor SdpR family transcription factor [bacterium]
MSPLNYIFYTLSDQTRRDILKLLQKRDMTPGEIIEQFLITKPSLTHHLNVLKQANLVTTERKGQKIYYSLNVSVLEETTGLVFDLLAKFNEKRIPSKKEK